ncbi:MAG: FecR domain-containing protein [Acidobacteria bacterium]|nr:FecR domain-containing protein [Acidobacteriota bacterium]
MPSSHRPQPRILLDWFNVRYRTLFLLVFLFLAAGGAAYFLYAEGLWDLGPRIGAIREVRRAEKLLERAGPQTRGGADEGLRSLERNAAILLQEARDHLKAGRLGDSRSAALQSQQCSQKILDGALGESAFTVRLYKVEGDVRVKSPGSFLWERAATNLTLNVGDQVKTASNASAQIVYFDGTITTVKPGSLVEVKELFEDPTTKIRRVRERVNWGRVSAATERRNVQGSFHEVSTENAVARAEEQADFEVEYDRAGGRTRMTVQAGRPSLTTARDTVALQPREFVEVDRESRVGERDTIPGPPQLLEPIDQRVFVYDDPEDSVTVLRWAPVPEAVRYHLQLSQQSLFGELLLDKEDVRFATVKLPKLPEGSFYWRVRAVDGRTRAGVFSEARKFRVRSRALRNPEDQAPPPLEIFDFLPSGPLVIINGRTEPGAVISVGRQKVDVYEDGSFTAIVRLEKEGLNQLQIRVQDPAGNATSMTKSVYVESF